MLSADVISELRSTKQDKEQACEIGSHELHRSIPQPVENLLTVEQLVSRDVLRHQDKAAAMLSHDPINGPVWRVAVGVAGVEEGLFVGHVVAIGVVGVVPIDVQSMAPDPDQCQGQYDKSCLSVVIRPAYVAPQIE